MFYQQIDIKQNLDLHEPPYTFLANEQNSLMQLGAHILADANCASDLRPALAKEFAIHVSRNLVRHYCYSGNFSLRQAIIVPIFEEQSRQRVIMKFNDGRLACRDVDGINLNGGLLNHIASLFIRHDDWSIVCRRLEILLPEVTVTEALHGIPGEECFEEWIAVWLKKNGLPDNPRISADALVGLEKIFRPIFWCNNTLYLKQNAQKHEQDSVIELAFSSAQARIHNYLQAALPEIKRNRIQAISILPVLQQPLADLFAAESDETRQAVVRFKPVLEAIDNRHPLYAALAEVLAVPINVVRSLARYRLSACDTYELERLAHILALIPPELRPQQSEEFTIMLNLSRLLPTGLGLRLFGTHLPQEQQADWAISVQRSESLWWPEMARRAAKISWQGVLDQLDIEHQIHLADFIEALARAVRPGKGAIFPVAMHLFENVGLFALLRLAQRWARERSRRFQELERNQPQRLLRPSSPWPALWKTPRQCGSRLVVPLLSQAALDEEGQRLCHCVATYAASAAQGNSLLFSLRDEAGRACSTLELRLTNPGNATEDELPEIAIAQHHACNNNKPESPCQHAANIVLDQIIREPLDVSLPAFWRRLRRCRLRHLVGNPLALRYALGMKASLGAAESLPGLNNKFAVWRTKVDSEDFAQDMEVERILDGILLPC